MFNCGGPEKSAKEYWKSAKLLADVGNFEGAMKEFKNITKYYADDSLAPKALQRIAEIHRTELKNYKKAISTYKSFLNKYPNNSKAPNILFLIGYTYANDIENKTKKAKSIYNKFLDKYPDHELVKSVKWELKNLGKSPDDIIKSQDSSYSGTSPQAINK